MNYNYTFVYQTNTTYTIATILINKRVNTNHKTMKLNCTRPRETSGKIASKLIRHLIDILKKVFYFIC